MKYIIWIIVIALVIWGLVAWGGDKTPVAEGAPIKIGYVGPFTGPVAGTSGEDIGNGWKLAVAKRPTIGGRPVEMIYEDDACDPKKAVSAVSKLINIDQVKIVVNGVCSGSMLAMAPLTEPAKIILFTPVSTSPKITTAGDYVFRTSGTGTHIASAILKVLTDFSHKNIGLLYESAEYPVGIKDAIVANLNTAAGQIVVVEESITPNATDMRSQISKIALAKPEALVVVMNSTVTANLFAKQAKEQRLTMPVFGNEYFAFSDVYQKNPDADGIYASLYKYDANGSAFKAYITDYETRYGKTPGQELYAALPFDGCNVLANAIERCGGDDPDCVRDELYKTSGYQGLVGMITVDQNGDTARESVIKKISNGQLVDIN